MVAATQHVENPAETPKEWPHLLTVNEAAEVLRCHPMTLRHWTRANSVPFIRVGGRQIRIRRVDIEALIGGPLNRG